MKINATEERLIRRWLQLGEKASFWHGYPLGKAYIDDRATGCSKSIKKYVVFDNLLGEMMPHIRGKNKEFVKALL